VLQAREGHRIASQRFKVGLASNTDLLDAEIALLQARLTQTQAQVDYAVQVEQFKRAVGEKP
jgi:outer membrane protein TolC